WGSAVHRQGPPTGGRSQGVAETAWARGLPASFAVFFSDGSRFATAPAARTAKARSFGARATSVPITRIPPSVSTSTGAPDAPDWTGQVSVRIGPAMLSSVQPS